ncbi:PREDICTED: uncharacterized membrane protein At1g16860-like [Tarenaya hassleriana]|uniref:uncharacterized membrane protein At1g16860-like n=1 Tax=Tarenaya hassleriana TaxID=28532 RepID=UPI00053C7F07|nr:PREDICTED: uncharacterized membrane protein At1g16860-like [Tarenaya hassleriana]
MNDLSNVALRDHRCSFSCSPFPPPVTYLLISLFFLGAFVSIFIGIVVRNFIFLVSFLLLSCLVVSFVAWNWVQWRRNKAVVSLFIRSSPDSDLGTASDGQLVKITGIASCGSIALESSYEKATRCIYTSTLLHEHCRLAHAERFSTDFYITDLKLGIGATVKAGSNCNVISLIPETDLVSTTRKSRNLSPHFRKWLQQRNLCLQPETRLLRLQEGYVQEGSCVTVMGTLRTENNGLTIVQPPEIFSTGCLWRRLLFPADIDGLIIALAEKPNIQSSTSLLPNAQV